VKIDNIEQRTDAIIAAAQAHFTSRVVSEDLLQHYSEHPAADLQKGVIAVVSDAEQDYSDDLGMIATEGTQQLKLICHLQVTEKNPKAPRDVQRAEQKLIEEIKSFVRAGVDGMTLVLRRAQQSRQLSYPYGFVVADIEARPPGQNDF